MKLGITCYVFKIYIYICKIHNMLIMKILFNVLVLLQIKMNDQNKGQCGVAKNLKRGRI